MRVDVEQGTDAWFQARCGVPTASNAGKLVTPGGKTGLYKATSHGETFVSYARHLATEIYLGESLTEGAMTAAMRRGMSLEGEAIEEYELLYMYKTAPGGYWVTEIDHAGMEIPEMGASPDALVGDVGLVEVKCPEALQFAKVRSDAAVGVPPYEYRAQCMQQLLVTERSWCDLFVYHPDLGSEVYRFHRDDAYLSLLVAQHRALCEIRDEVLGHLKSRG